MGGTPHKIYRVRREIDPDGGIEDERLKARSKLKSAWEDVIERYGRNLEQESDVVDIVTGEIIEDHGHLRSIRRTKLGGDSDGDDSDSSGYYDDSSSVTSTESDDLMGDDFDDVFDSLLVRRRKEVLASRDVHSPPLGTIALDKPEKIASQLRLRGVTNKSDVCSSPVPRLKDYLQWIPESPHSEEDACPQKPTRKRMRTPSLTDSETLDTPYKEKPTFEIGEQLRVDNVLSKETMNYSSGLWDFERNPSHWQEMRRENGQEEKAGECDGHTKCNKTFCLRCCLL